MSIRIVSYFVRDLPMIRTTPLGSLRIQVVAMALSQYSFLGETGLAKRSKF